MTTRSWRARHRVEDGEKLHHFIVSVPTTILDAVEELADRERISRAYAGGRLLALGLTKDEPAK